MNTNELKDYNLVIKKRTLNKFKLMAKQIPENINEEYMDLFFAVLDTVNQESWEAVHNSLGEKTIENLRESGYTDVTDFLLLKPEVISKDIQIGTGVIDRLQKAILIRIFIKLNNLNML